MQELNATQAMIQRAIHQAAEQHAGRITDVYVVIGRISGLSEEPVRSYWRELSKGTPAEGARLHFRKIEGELQCMACFTRYQPEGDEIRCPVCGSSGAKILSGEEFYVEALDVE
jgi:hydrogenase nickel incorporation protein HypA/HybF